MLSEQKLMVMDGFGVFWMVRWVDSMVSSKFTPGLLVRFPPLQGDTAARHI